MYFEKAVCRAYNGVCHYKNSRHRNLKLHVPILFIQQMSSIPIDQLVLKANFTGYVYVMTNNNMPACSVEEKEMLALCQACKQSQPCGAASSAGSASVVCAKTLSAFIATSNESSATERVFITLKCIQVYWLASKYNQLCLCCVGG